MHAHSHLDCTAVVRFLNLKQTVAYLWHDNDNTQLMTWLLALYCRQEMCVLMPAQVLVLVLVLEAESPSLSSSLDIKSLSLSLSLSLTSLTTTLPVSSSVGFMKMSLLRETLFARGFQQKWLQMTLGWLKMVIVIVAESRNKWSENCYLIICSTPLVLLWSQNGVSKHMDSCFYGIFRIAMPLSSGIHRRGHAPKGSAKGGGQERNVRSETSTISRLKLALNVVSWFSGKQLQLLPPDKKAKMHQIWFWLGLCPRHCWGSSQCQCQCTLPDPLAGFKGSYF